MTSSPAGRPRTISGTWITFFHQDSRNDYTNPRTAADTEWARVVDDLADLGMEKLIVMAVANEGVAVYPTRLRTPVVTAEGRAPLDIVLDTAARRGLGVYLSAGWTRDQLDDLGDPEVARGQREILAELAELYTDHAAFEGWYLPCEDAVVPRLSERTIAGVNELAALARDLTPRARVLISPYFPHAAIVDDAYVDALSRIDVDVIAYQDGVGCGFTTTISAQYERLRWAHDRVSRIELWANVESFTWERGIANTWDDALVPAAFPRLHRQILDAAPHVDRVVSFIAQGLLQDPETLGSTRAHDPAGRADYRDYRAGRGRWRVLEDLGAVSERSVARGRHVECDPRPVPGFVTEHRLTSGRPAQTLDPMDPAWVRLRGDATLDLDLDLDLDPDAAPADVVVSFLHAPILGVTAPREIEVLGSIGDAAWEHLGAWSAPAHPYNLLDRWRDVAVIDGAGIRDRMPQRLRLVVRSGGGETLLDQLIVHTGGSATLA